MLKNYLKIAWRNLMKDRQFTLLNLVGLSTGLTCAILIYLWISDEVHVDRFHAKDSQLYQVMTNVENSEGIRTMAGTPGILARTLKNEMPEVEYATAVIYPYWAGETTLSVNIAFPLAWWLMDQWLAGFAYRTAIGGDVFFIAGVATILITLLIVSYQGVKASLTDPVRSLKAE